MNFETTTHRHKWEVLFLNPQWTGCHCGALRHQDGERHSIHEPDGCDRYYHKNRQVSLAGYYGSRERSENA